MANSTVTKPRTIQQGQLVPGTIVSIRGNIEYSRLLTPIDGDELARDKIRKQQAGIQPIDKPYTTIQITNARVLPRDPNGIMSNEEMYVDQRMYQRVADGPNGPWRFTCTNKNVQFPNQFYLARPGNPTEADQFIPEKELANGLDVILILRIFESAQFQRKGIGLHGIILQEPVRYYSGNNDKALADAGIVLHTSPAVQAAQAAQSAQAPAPAVASVQTAPQVGAPAPGAGYSSDNAQSYQPTAQQPAAGYPAQGAPAQTAPAQAYPAQQPYQAQPAAGYQAQQAPAQAYGAPAQQPAAAAPAQEWVCPTCQTHVPMGMAFCGSCGTHRPENPYAGQAAAMTAGAQAQPGINYDPNARDY